MNDQENLLFRAVIDGTMLAFDPWKIDRLLSHFLCGASVLDVALQAGIVRTKDSPAPAPETANEAAEGLLTAVRRAFNLPEVQPDGSGIPEAVVVRVFREFIAWKAGLKKNGVETPTNSPSTPPLSPTSSPVPTPTNSATRFG